MTELQTALIAGGAALLVLALMVVVSYNRFVSQLTIVDESWKQIDVELQRRHDLIPNLVATVKGYAAHEQEILTKVVEAREAAEAHRADGPKGREPFEEVLGGAVRGVLARAEAYPDLKASANFLQLQDELTNTEDRIAASRRFYNGNVRAVNTRIATFPSNVVASAFTFRRRDFFELTEPAAAIAPDLA
ncbi:MAG TPA: LemA family protein [Nocardioidaceae bacterium]|nr:LemA family protein [Nocardioidaceae bacterium]